MKFPLNIKFHNTRRSVRAEEDVREHAERLDKYHQRIQNCEVIIDKPHTQHNKGNEFHIRILLSVPGQQLAITSPSSKHGDHTSLHVALRDAFKAAERQLREKRTKPREQRIRKYHRENGRDRGGEMAAPA